MDFDFSNEQKELKDQVRRLLTDRCDSQAVRSVLEGREPCLRGLYAEMGALGYLGATIPEAYGGLGLGYLESCVIAEELGRSIAPVPYSTSIGLAAECLMLAGNDAQKSHWLPKLASGEAIATVAVAERPGRHALNGLTTVAVDSPAGLRISGRKPAVPFGEVADLAVVAAIDSAATGPAGAPSLFLVDLRGDGVHRSSTDSIDPTRNHGHLGLNQAPAQRLGEPGGARALLETVEDRAAVTLAFEQLGGAERSMEMARDHALSRFAFGRPIGSMQAIKHMLADMFVQVSLARSNCFYAAWALSSQSPELPVAAAGARVCATQAYQFCSRQNIQVHGGMGFTWEADCHLHFRRANVLALTLGPLSQWEDRLITRMRTRMSELDAQALEPVES